MKVGIVGSREYKRLQKVRDLVNSLAPDDVVVSGGARGVDTIAALAARARGLRVVEFLVDTVGLPEDPDERRREFGKRAYARNRKIVDFSDIIVAYWDGISNGTQNSMSLAEAAGKLWAVER
jgi:predicted Rossmann-fold nucleotide-binding protein